MRLRTLLSLMLAGLLVMTAGFIGWLGYSSSYRAIKHFTEQEFALANGAAFVALSRERMAAIADDLAPEHLALHVVDPHAVETALLELDHAGFEQPLDRGPALGTQFPVPRGHAAPVRRWPRTALLISGHSRAAASLVRHVKRLAVRFAPRWHSAQLTPASPCPEVPLLPFQR